MRSHSNWLRGNVTTKDDGQKNPDGFIVSERLSWLLHESPSRRERRNPKAEETQTGGGSSAKLWCSELVSIWILTSCQPHRVTSGQSNSGPKQIHISKLFSKPFFKSIIHKTNHRANIKTKHTYTNARHTNFQRVSPLNITPVKRAHKARTYWYCWPFHLIYRYTRKLLI